MTKSEMYLFQASLYLSPLIQTDNHILERQIPMMARDYHQSLFKHIKPLNFAKSTLGLSIDTLSNFNVGYCDRKLPRQFPSNKTQEGKKLRGGFRRYGLMSAETGHEVMRGCITLPMSKDGKLTGMYGHLYDKPQRGVPSVRCCVFGKAQVYIPFELSDSALLVDCPFTALALAEYGYRNAISILGNAVSDSVLNELVDSGITTLVLFNDTSSGASSLNPNGEIVQNVGIDVCELSLPFHLHHIGQFKDDQWQLLEKRLSCSLKILGGRNERYHA